MLPNRIASILLLCLLCLNTHISSAQQNYIPLDDTESILTISKDVRFFIDKSKELTLEEVINLPESAFETAEHDVINFGNPKRTIWFKIKLDKPINDKNKWFLELRSAFVNHAEFYVQNSEGKWSHKETGKNHPFSIRKIKRATFFYQIPEFKSQETFYVKVVGGYLHFPVNIGTTEAFWDQYHSIDMLFGIFYGFIILIVLYNLFLYISIKETVYLHYILFVIFNGLSQATMNGHLAEFVWKEIIWFNVHIPLVHSFTGIFTSLFVINFLNLDKELPVISKIFKTFIPIYILSAIIISFVDTTTGSYINQVALMLTLILIMTSAVMLMKRGYAPARYFFIAWVFYLISIIMIILAGSDAIVYHEFYIYLPLIGMAVEIILLSLALAEKIKHYKELKEEAQALAMETLENNQKLIQEQNTMLEHRVMERTEELQQINDELSITLETVNEQTKLIEKKNHDITASITYAQRIQESMLPLPEKIQSFLPEHFIFFQPRDIVSGDFYWIEEIRDKIVIAAIDCTGHGVPGAFMSLIGNDLLHEVIETKGETDPCKILEYLDYKIMTTLRQENTDNQDGMDAAICVIDKSANKIIFSGAKNPLILIQDGKLTEYKGSKRSIGGAKRKIIDKPFDSHTIDLTENNIGYLFSDGYIDQFGGKDDKKFMKKRFVKMLEEIHHLPMEKQNDILKEQLLDWIGRGSQIDDILVVGFKTGKFS